MKLSNFVKTFKSALTQAQLFKYFESQSVAMQANGLLYMIFFSLLPIKIKAIYSSSNDVHIKVCARKRKLQSKRLISDNDYDGPPKTTYKPEDQHILPGDNTRFFCEAFIGECRRRRGCG
jgi:hypothetical protein